jgi:Flp pilus assembly protein CpaB
VKKVAQQVSVVAAQKRRKVLIAAVAAVVATGVFLYALGSSKAGPAVVPAATAPTTQVVATLSDLPAQSKITAADVKFVKFPADQVSTDNVTTMEAAINRVNLVHLPPGTVLLKSVLVADYVNPVALLLKQDDVAIAIPFTEATGFGGYVRPEDRIHILCDNGDGSSNFCFQNVRVIEVGGQSQQPAPPSAPAVVLPGQAPAVASPGAPPTVANATVLVVELTRADAALVKGIQAKTTTGKGTIIGYALVSSHNTPPP